MTRESSQLGERGVIYVSERRVNWTEESDETAREMVSRFNLPHTRAAQSRASPLARGVREGLDVVGVNASYTVRDGISLFKKDNTKTLPAALDSSISFSAAPVLTVESMLC